MSSVARDHQVSPPPHHRLGQMLTVDKRVDNAQMRIPSAMQRHLVHDLVAGCRGPISRPPSW